MGFILIMLVTWGITMGVWMLVSRYAKSADVEKIKERLSGSTKSKRAQAAAAKNQEQLSVMQVKQESSNRLAELLVEKYQLGPKILLFLEQAGLRWAPARLVHLCLVAFGCGVAFAWLMLPFPKIFSVLFGFVTACGPLLYVRFKRKSRLKRFEDLFPETLRVYFPFHARRARLLGLA